MTLTVKVDWALPLAGKGKLGKSKAPAIAEARLSAMTALIYYARDKGLRRTYP